MDYLKLVQIFTIASALSAQVKRAYEDKKISKEELTTIITEGVIPLLAVFGVKLSIDALSIQQTERSNSVRSQVEAIADVAGHVMS